MGGVSTLALEKGGRRPDGAPGGITSEAATLQNILHTSVFLTQVQSLRGWRVSVTSVRFNCSTWRMGEALMGARCRWEWGWGGGEALRATTFLPNKYIIPLYFGHRNKSLPRNIKIKLNMQR